LSLETFSLLAVENVASAEAIMINEIKFMIYRVV
jgi:hypothetical protein